MGTLLLASEGLFLAAFVVRAIAGRGAASSSAPRAQAARAAPAAWRLLLLHAAGIALVSAGIAHTLVLLRSRLPPSPRVLLGVSAVLAASALATWALRVFASWRLLARVDVGHALCTEGPYRLVRHPIYLAMDLWALGSALACPGLLTAAGAAVVVAGSDLRARAEERLLAETFGERYRDYAARVRRLLPGLY